MKQIKKIAITNEKGGVGKTMTAVNLSACLAQRGYRVLLIDADPQGYATLNYDVDVSPSLLEVLRGQVACTKAVQTTRFGVDVLPSDRTLSVIEEDLIRQKMNGAPYLNTLEKALEDLPDYDFVIIDCPPQGGRLMDIVHYYADAIIMPMFAEDYGIHALTLKAEAIADIRRTIYTRFGSTDMASFLTLCASAPLALIGFFKWHKMSAERVALCWLHALLMPRRLVFKGSNIHANEIEQLCTAARAVELNEMKNRREKGKDALEKDLEGRGAVSTGKHENSAQHAGDDPGQAHSE